MYAITYTEGDWNNTHTIVVQGNIWMNGMKHVDEVVMQILQAEGVQNAEKIAKTWRYYITDVNHVDCVIEDHFGMPVVKNNKYFETAPWKKADD